MAEFLSTCESVLMGRTTFEPALGAPSWPWPGFAAFVLCSTRPEGTPEDVVTDSDPARLVATVRERNRGGDVHLVGGPRTIEAVRALGALHSLELVVLPLLLGGGMRLTDGLEVSSGLALERTRGLPTGSVEITYRIS